MKKRLVYIAAALTVLLCALFLASCSSSGKNPDSTSGKPAGVTKDTDAKSTTEDPIDSDKKVIKFAAAGDNIVHECVYLDAAKRATALASSSGYTGKYCFLPMYDGVSDIIKNADVAYVNMEGPIAGASFGYSGYPNFNAPSEAGDALVDLGFNVVNIANNHMLDMDSRYKGTGLLNTIKYWKTKDVLLIGGYENKSEYGPKYLEVSGVKIAFLSFTYGVNPGNKLNSGSPDVVIPIMDETVIRSQITQAKSNADLVFVSMHWGTENSTSVDATQKKYAKLIADCGADVILGMHSHTIQPMEWLTGSSGNKTLVTYSLGNFISTQLYAKQLIGGILTLDITRDDSGKAVIENPVFNPVVTHYLSDPAAKDSQNLNVRYDVTLYKLEDYTPELCSKHGGQMYGSFTYDTLKNFVTSNIPREFLPSYLK